MRNKEYSKWLQAYVTHAVIANYIKRCQRVEDNLHIDLDDEFVKDNGKSLLTKLTYTTDDQAHNRPLKCDIYFNAGSDLRAGMGSLKTAVSKYFEFCQGGGAPAAIKNCGKKDVKQGITTSPTKIDSYQEFLTHFGIDRTSFFEWGIASTIFPPIDKVAYEWEDLKKRIFNNQTVYIRGYGRDAHGTQLYKDLYAKLLNNANIEKDPANNAVPHKLIQRITGLKRNKDIYNYQVSHIWGHTKNVFMFESPWNICYTPKIMDPFTGHETQGIWPAEYQKLFIAKANELYRPFVDEYNQLLKALDVENQLREYLLSLKSIIPEKELVQFSKDAASELSLIT
ncbi:hypothetical protein [Diplocloster agilis]|uniref:Uncharacterized protein n=1 Tax=Diplocloster agilis TaxID=2850323 RepID=A0A949K1H3_9FIRM|nr:hypothetical protein [Diplocloster agilis]MBU9738464.1 hypothetical protein [Diplocloster agilis]